MKQDARLKEHARELRKNMTPAERILWGALRGRQFAGYKFRRQQPFGEYVLDFFCSNTRLALEIDGETHLGKEKPDERRSQWLEQQGIKVLRFWNTQVYDELEAVLEMIFRECEARKDLRFRNDNQEKPASE
jgi:very-short-patch-repair endonuclease